MRLDTLAFKLDGAPVSHADVVAGSLLGGWLAGFQREVEARRERAAAAAERGDEVDPDALQEGFDAWRRDRDLISGEELEAWLAEQGIELDDLVEHVERVLLAGVGAIATTGEVVGLPERDLLLAMASDAVLGGEIHAFAEDHARRAAAPPPSDPGGVRREETRRWLLAEIGAQDQARVAEAVSVLGVPAERAAWLLDLEVGFRLYQQELLSPAALRAGLDELRADFVRYELLTATFRNEDIAREAACCVREDRDPFARAASRAGVTSRPEEWFARDLQRSPFGHKLPSAREKELLGPVPAGPGGAQLLAQLIASVQPELSDQGVLGRVERRLVERGLRHAVSERVRFPLIAHGKVG